LRQKTFEHFHQHLKKWCWNKNLNIQDAPVLPVVHSTDENTAWKIASQGFAALSAIDRGFYGKGIYFSSSALYTVPYFVNHIDPTILICLVLPGNPYPVTEDRRSINTLFGKHIIRGYQSHYVVVKKTGDPFTHEDYVNLEESFNEIVVDQESQVVPIYLLTVNKNYIQRAVAEYQINSLSNPKKIEKDRDIAENDFVKIPSNLRRGSYELPSSGSTGLFRIK